jgi:hypothetical protein
MIRRNLTLRAGRFVGTVLGGAALMGATCDRAVTEPAAPAEIAAGTWGGPNAGVIVTDSAMHVHLGCTYGDVAGRVALDSSGRFDVAGSYVLRAYPIAVGPALPARFSGTVRGTTMTISVSVNDTVEHKTVVLGPSSVRLGRTPQLGPCPICVKPPALRDLLSTAPAARSTGG